MNNIQETQICLEVISIYNLPIWVSYNLSSSSNILSGENLIEGLKILEEYPVSCVLLNCNPFDRTINGMNIIEKCWTREWGIYPNLGIGEPDPDGIIDNLYPDEEFMNLIEYSISVGATIFGGCCGSSPKHIELIKKYLLKH